MNTPGYEQLAGVLQAAFDQAAKGKGAERHADSKPFHEQPMQTGSDLLGTDAGLAFQAIKKIREGSTFTEFDRFERELLGAIVYIAGMVIWRRRQLPKADSTRIDIDTQNKAHAARVAAVRSALNPDNHCVGLALSTPRRGVNDAACRECGYPTDAVGTHYATCPTLSAPAEHIEQAEAAFEEATVSPPGFDWSGAVVEEEALIEAEEGKISIHFGEQPATPTVHNDMDEERVDIVASSHGDGEHYDDPFAGAPGWVNYRAQDADGARWWFEKEPVQTQTSWVVSVENQFSGYARCNGDREPTPNPNWRKTLIERPNNKSQE